MAKQNTIIQAPGKTGCAYLFSGGEKPPSLACSPLTSTVVKVILADDVAGTGYRGEYVEVKGGFMRNYLFPNKRAIYATEDNKLLYESQDRVSKVVQ